MTSRARLRFLVVLLGLGASGCYELHERGGDPTPIAPTDAGTGPVTPDATVRPPVMPTFGGAIFEEETCGLRSGRSRWVILPEGTPATCDAPRDTYLAIETPMLPESTSASFLVTDPEVSVRLCVAGACVEGVEGRFSTVVYRGEVGDIRYDFVFADGRALGGASDTTHWCAEICFAPPPVAARADPACGPDDGSEWRITISDGIDGCGALPPDRVTFWLPREAVVAGARIPLAFDGARGELCRGGACTDALEGFVRIDEFDPARFASGAYVFFASPGTDYEGGFQVFNFCFDDPPLCG